MSLILSWGGYLLRQAAHAFTVVAGLLLLAEILLPGSVLPFFNLHAFIFGVVALHVVGMAFPGQAPANLIQRLAVLIPVGLFLIVAVFLSVWGGSVTAMLLSAAVIAVMIGIIVAARTTE